MSIAAEPGPAPQAPPATEPPAVVQATAAPPAATAPPAPPAHAPATPAPEPPQATAPPASDPGVEAMRAELARLAGEVEKAKTHAREAALDKLGVRSQYRGWAPQVDALTPEGRAELQRWADAHPEIRATATGQQAPPEPQVPQGFKARNSLFSLDTMRDSLARLRRGE